MDREKARLDKISALFSAEKKGETREKIKITREMRENGESIDKIMKYTELSEKEIQDLSN